MVLIAIERFFSSFKKNYSYYLFFKKGTLSMRIILIILIMGLSITQGCSKIRNDASMMLCTSLETNPNLCTETVSENY